MSERCDGKKNRTADGTMLSGTAARLLMTVLLALSVLLGGCSGSSGGGTAAKEDLVEGPCGQQVMKDPGDGPYTVVDSRGDKVKFGKKPQCILTLSLGMDQIVLGLVRSDRLVAVNALLDDPVSSNVAPLARKVPRKIKNPGAEEIFSLHPDVVIVPDWGKPEVIHMLREMRIPVVVTYGAKDIAEIEKNVRLIADALGEPAKGAELVCMMRKELADVKERTDRIPAEKRQNAVLISLMTRYGGKGCIYDDICTHANVVNGISAAGLQNGQELTKELLVKINPDVLLMPVYNDHGNFDTKAFNDSYLKDPSLQTIKAIRDRRIVYPREGYIYNSSQDAVFGVREVARCAYGDEFDFPDNMHLSVSGEENR